MNLTIVPIPILNDNYVWTIVNSEHQCALIVDPGEAAPVIDYLDRHHLKLNGILITHHHNDHIGGLSTINNYYDVPIYASNPSISNNHVVHNYDTIHINNSFPSYHVIAIPGHTLDHVAYYADGNLFCGDTLFAGGAGRIFEGTADQMLGSLKKLCELPKTTRIYCAHEYTMSNLKFAQTMEPHNHRIAERMQRVRAKLTKDQNSLPSTLEEELATNPFLRCHSPEIVASVIEKTGIDVKNEVDVFKLVRELKNQFSG